MPRTTTNRTSSRDALIDAAVEEFAEKGYEATKVSDIAERAGVTTGALYGHFDGKLDLLMATLGAHFGRRFLAEGRRRRDAAVERGPGRAEPVSGAEA